MLRLDFTVTVGDRRSTSVVSCSETAQHFQRSITCQASCTWTVASSSGSLLSSRAGFVDRHSQIAMRMLRQSMRMVAIGIRRGYLQRFFVFCRSMRMVAMAKDTNRKS
eukprot:SAG31_NODE_571_length_13998_cov_4.346212_7_plen_108_part_00